MIRKFYMRQAELPPGLGFLMFGREHVAWLLILFFSGLFFCLWYRKQIFIRQDRIGKIIGTALVLMELYKDVVLLIIGEFGAEYLPFHLCQAALFVACFHAFFGNQVSGDILFSLCMPGALSALLFPDWVTFPVFHFMTLHDFLSHGLLVLYAFLLLSAGKITLFMHDIWKTMLFLLCLVPGAVFMNWRFGTDFLFLNRPSNGSPLEGLYRITKGEWYLPALSGAVLLVVTLIHIPFCRRKTAKKNGKKTGICT